MISRTTGHPSQPGKLSVTTSGGAEVTRIDTGSWRLENPAGPRGIYRLAQLDDYAQLSRGNFPWKPPLSLELDVRASVVPIQGTWGFGLWNDPFSFSLGFGGGTRRLPALPNALWFFFAAPKNHLALYDDLPSSGNLAAIYRSPGLPSILLISGILFVPLALFPPGGRLLRRLARRVVKQETVCFDADLTRWHHYRLEWQVQQVRFSMDGQIILESELSPGAPLGLVLWIDNQFLAWPPNGRIDYGNLETIFPAWIEIKGLRLEQC